jgi:hypothetical protein
MRIAMTVVHYAHRYKRPPRRKPQKPAIEGPAVVRAKPTIRPGNSRPDDKSVPANDDRTPPKSDIVTISKRERFGEAPDLTPEEHRQRGDAAEAMFREMKRKIAERFR